MREHVKIEVAMEILSMCMARSVSIKDNIMIKEISDIQQQIYKADIKDIEMIIEKYGEIVKRTLEDSNE